MTKRKTAGQALLDLWKPPKGAGDPVGCLATTYTFEPELFDEQCLARFLEIDSEPDREDLAFLLERESRLGGIYAGVLVDHSQAGVAHSLRWDVLPVRARVGKQHAKVSLLAWTHHVRVIVASANLTVPGYRTNLEVATFVDLEPNSADQTLFNDILEFLSRLLGWVPGAGEDDQPVRRGRAFLERVRKQSKNWTNVGRPTGVRRTFVATAPSFKGEAEARSSLEEVIAEFRKRSSLPSEAWIASPFFDVDETSSAVTEAMCRLMARSGRRHLSFSVPSARDQEEATVPRLLAPKVLLTTALENRATGVTVEMLPELDDDDNPRRWHAKMLALHSDTHSALMVGSSNFTKAGMGIGTHRNIEANLLTVVDGTRRGEVKELESIWPEMAEVEAPDEAEWLGAVDEGDDELDAAMCPVPAGFISAIYRAGENRTVVLRLDAARLPDTWTIFAVGQESLDLLSSQAWEEKGRPLNVELSWEFTQPPERLAIRWGEHEAFLPINVEDSGELPPPSELDKMTADEMLRILAASDPSAAFRAWARNRKKQETFDSDLDSATSADLDPLQRHDLEKTFLHRVRRRARVLAQLRWSLERPVWGKQALEWRLRGLVGVRPIAERYVREVLESDARPDEALLTLADLVIVLREVSYRPDDGSLSKQDFMRVFRPFLSELADDLERKVESCRGRVAPDLMTFWERVLERCRE